MEFDNIEVVSIEGNIGSGKTTLLEELNSVYKNNKNVIFLKEPVDEWSKIKDKDGNTILKKFYADQLKYSFSFQMMAYVSRLKVIRETIKNYKKENQENIENNKLIIITERSLYTDKMVFAKMLYETGMIEEVNYQIYLNWFDTFIEEFPVHKIIYVKTSAERCHFRIMKRSREGENIIPLEYLDRLNEYHEEMLDPINPSDCYCYKQLILDGNIDIYENNQQMEKWINQINNFIK
jgi:deoxyadenosine/deoxycytidine kinase